MEGRLRANMLWDSIVRYKTERGALGSKTGYPRHVRSRSIINSIHECVTEDTVRPLIKRGEHEETPGFQNFAVFCPLCIVRGTGVCRTHIEVGHLVVARGTGWG